MTPRTTIVAAIVVALLQVGFLASAIIVRAAVLQNGKEIVVKVEPVDPRDLLRGDYVRLGYEMARLPASIVSNYSADMAEEDETIWVRLARHGDGQWLPVEATIAAPPASAPTADQVDLAGSIVSAPLPEDAAGTLRVTYGIERFYLPEGEGRQIELDMRERPFFVKLAVADNGTAQIKQFLDGQTVLYEEPPY